MKLFDITNAGCPVAHPKFTSRPSASSNIRFPSGQTYWSTCGLILIFLSELSLFKEATSISMSKCPILQTIAWSFMASMWSLQIISAHPVVVTKMSAIGAASSIVTTSKPSIDACNAHIGSISVTSTRAP